MVVPVDSVGLVGYKSVWFCSVQLFRWILIRGLRMKENKLAPKWSDLDTVQIGLYVRYYKQLCLTKGKNLYKKNGNGTVRIYQSPVTFWMLLSLFNILQQHVDRISYKFIFSIREWFDHTIQCDSNIYLYVYLYMFRSSYENLQKAQRHAEEASVTLIIEH